MSFIHPAIVFVPASLMCICPSNCERLYRREKDSIQPPRFVPLLSANSAFTSVSLPSQLFRHNCLSLCPRVTLQFLTNRAKCFLDKVALTASVYRHVAAFGLRPYVSGIGSKNVHKMNAGG